MGVSLNAMLKTAKQSSYNLSGLNSKFKSGVISQMARALIDEKDFIIKANRKDIAQAGKDKLKKSFIDRLALNEKRILEMSVSLRDIASLPDPVGRIIKGERAANDMLIEKVSVPIGVVLIIYEARPNVTSDCLGLCFKSSNVAVLRGGRSALNSNKAIFAVLSSVAEKAGIYPPPFFLITEPGHEVVYDLLKANDFIDLVIPRGGEALIRKVTGESTIPVIKHFKGICHIFVDQFADLKKARSICVNAKAQRPSVCNAVETILVHEKAAKKFLPLLKREFDKHKIKIKGDACSRGIIPGIARAGEADWRTEYLDLTVSLKVVRDINQAVEHINFYGSHHTDCIVTENINRAEEFVRRVDSACCFVNISTRFSDGYQMGLGAEIGISTDKLHARGPMGLEELTTYKYIVRGNGQIRN